MIEDLSPFLKAWPYEAGRTVRRIEGLDGRPKLQVRTPVGIEQYELDGRPDGLRPEGCESWLAYYERRAEADGGIALRPPDCARLAEEGVLYYQRYLLFYQVDEYALCARDTERNLRLLDFVEAHAAREEDRVGLVQYRPYILRMNAMARALEQAKEGDVRRALAIVREAIEGIEGLAELENPIFQVEKMRSLKVLRELEGDLAENRAVARTERLRRALEEAVRSEDYERAARLRDRLEELEERDRPSG